MSDEQQTPETPQAPARAQPRWQPLGPIGRRIVGALAEKAKTTPDAYPMSLNAIVTACNQKSNRFPLMQLQSDAVEEALEGLRGMGAVGMVEGYGRVTKYRHYLYEWLGVDKVEMAVMTELLLRGAQTQGELRGRASRMEPLADLPALRSVLESLRSKGLVLMLTPEGRGQVVSHALYQPREMESLRAQYCQSAPAGESPIKDEGARMKEQEQPAPGEPSPPASTMPVAERELAAAIRRDMEAMRSQLAQLQSDVHDLAARQQQMDEEIRGLKDALGG
jgi:uncharacterized protein YceH (UPF0502 family)